MAAGRKRMFNKQEALGAATNLFWKKGYAGTSLSDLTQAMKINKPSLYASFGNKEALYSLAIEHYAMQRSEILLAKLKMPNVSLRDRLKAFAMEAIEFQCNPDNPPGCYLIGSLSESSNEDMPSAIRRQINELNQKVQDAVVELFAQDPEAKALGLDVSANTNALSINTLISGTASMAKANPDVREFSRVVDIFLAGLFT